MAGKAGMFKLPRIFTRDYFRGAAKKFGLTLRTDSGAVDLGTAVPREFSTGSLGWQLSTKAYVRVGEATVYCQVNLNMTVLCSGALPREGPAPDAA